MLRMLKESIDNLNKKFDSFKVQIDTKIDNISKNYETLS
jgi:hypothetical protein